MRLRMPLCAWVLLSGPFVSPPAAAQDRTARDLMDSIVRDGPRAAAIRAAVDVVAREGEARLAYPNPAVTYSREGAGFTEFVQVEQALPIFGTRATLERAGVAATTAAEAERDARLRILRADAAVAVARLQAGQARADLAADHVAEVEDQLDLIRIREREGEGSRFDRLRAEQELMDARRVATSAAVVLADARSAVQALLPAGAVFDRVTDPLYTPTPPLPGDELLARADRDRADLRALAVSSDRAGLEGDLARRARRPVPTLFGGFKRADTDSGRDTGGVLGVSLSLPLFDTGAREAARWSAERQRLQAERAALLLEIRADIGRARDVLVLRQAAVSSDETPSATELVRIAEVAYREGEIGILELVDAIRTALVARLRDLDARLEARLAQIALERAVGGVLWP